MSEGNGNEAKAALERLQARVDGHDKDILELKSIVRDLADAMGAQAHPERKQSETIAAAHGFSILQPSISSTWYLA